MQRNLVGRLSRAGFGALCAVLFAFAGQAHAAAPAECSALQAKYPQFKGKTLTNAINPHTPGYEALDPNDPSKYIGFDIDLGELIAQCLGFTMELVRVKKLCKAKICLFDEDHICLIIDTKYVVVRLRGFYACKKFFERCC